MQLLALATVMLATTTGAQAPCDLVPEQEIPNCYFTVRSNHALHGRVHTARVITRELSPDPRTHSLQAHAAPKLSIQEPGAWQVFSPDGDIIESGGSLFKTPARERKIVDGLTTVVISGTADDPESFRRGGEVRSGRGTDRGVCVRPREATLASACGAHNRLARGHYRGHLFDGAGHVMSYSIERHDKHGRAIEWIVFSFGRFIFHKRDSYDETNDGDDDSALISRAWFDDNGLLFREITLRKGEAVSWWQRPNCDKLCEGHSDGVGLNYSFDRAVSYEFQRDGSLLRTIENHKGRYGSIENDDVELLNEDGMVLEKIAYSYVRDNMGNWTERRVSVFDSATGLMLGVRLDIRDLTYY